MERFRSMIRRFWFPLSVSLILLAAFTALLLEGLKNQPHYCYVDEGHVLLNLSSIFSGKMPFNVAYGPTIFYVYAIVGLGLDPIQAILGEPTYFGTIVRSTYKPLFYADYRPYWILPVGRAISIVATLLGLLFTSLAISKRHPGLRLLCLLSTLSIPLYLQGSFFIATEPMALMFFGLVIFLSVRTTGDSKPLAVAGFALALVLLAGVKIFYSIYCLLGVLALYSTSPTSLRDCFTPFRSGRGLRRLAGLILFGMTATAVSQLPYRGVSDWRTAIGHASEVYSLKRSSETLVNTFLNDQPASVFSGPLILGSHAAVMVLGLALLLLRRQRLQEFLLAFLGCFQLLYFLNISWQVYRNVYTLPVLFIYLAVKNLSLAQESFPAKGKALSNMITAGLSAWFLLLALGQLFLTSPPYRGDSRLDFFDRARISTRCEGTVLVDIYSQIHRKVFDRAGLKVKYFNGARATPRDFPAGVCVVAAGNHLQKSAPLAVLYEIAPARRPPPAPQLFIAPWWPMHLRLLKAPVHDEQP